MPRYIIKNSLSAGSRLLAFMHTLGIFSLLMLTQVGLIYGQSPVSFSKSFAPSTIGPGSVTTLQFVVTNNTSTPIENVSFSDNLPAGVLIASPANASSSCGGILNLTSGGGIIDFDLDRLGGDVTCTISVDVTSSVLGVHPNLTSDLLYDVEGNAGPAQADLTVDAGWPGILMSLTPSTISPGGLSTLSIIIDNSANSSPASNPSFSLILPVGVQFAAPLGLSSSCLGVSPSVSGNTLSLFSAASIGAQSTCTISVNVTGTTGGVFQLKTSELTTGSNQTSSGFATAQLTSVREFLTKTFIDDPVIPGDQVFLEFNLTNLNRSASASMISFTDDLDAALSGLTAKSVVSNNCAGATIDISTNSMIDFSGATLGLGESCSCQIALDVPAGASSGVYTNTISNVAYIADGLMETGNMASDDLVVQIAPRLTKTFDPEVVVPGDQLTMTFTIENTSTTDEMTDIFFTDNLGQAMPGLIPNLPADGFCGMNSTIAALEIGGELTLIVSEGSLDPGASCSFNVTFDIPIPSEETGGFPTGVYTNITSPITAEVAGNPVEGAAATAAFTVAAAPSLKKVFGVNQAAPGALVTLDFILEHSVNAPGDATGVSFTDDLNAALPGLLLESIVTNTCGGMVSGIGGGLMTYSGGSVPAGGSCHCLVQVMIPSPSEFGIKTNTTSNVSATVDGKTTSSPPASDDIEILSVTVDKQFLDDPAVPGEQVTLRFTLTNGTTESATGITFTDDLEVVLDGLSPSGMFPMADVCGMGSSLLYNSGTLTLVGGSLDASGSCMFDVILNVPANAEHGEYHNITSILQATVGNESVTSPPAQDNLLVAATPNLLTLSKAFEEDQLAPGEMTNLIFEISFEGTSTATNISFSDNLNAGLQATSAANTCGATVNVGGVIDVSGGVLNPGESCTITVEVQVPNDALLGDYTNTTTAITATGGIVGNAASADFSITDGDRPPPPIADAGPDQTVECTGSDGADVMLDGTASQSFDPPLSYSWSQNAVEFSTDPQPVVTLGLGMHTISLTVSDAAGLDSDEVIITVEDTQAPVITFNGDVEVVRFNGPYMDPPGATTVFDVCDPSPSLIVDASNVDTNLPGDYPVFYTATDASGNMSTAQRMITVIEDPDAPAHPYLLLAGQNISVKEVQRLDGDMHANALISVGRGKAANQGGPTAYTSDMTAVNMITVSRNNTIHGNITSPSVSLANNVVVNGMVKQVPVDPVALPPLNFTAGGNNVTVASNGSLNLAPGSYGNLVVETGATLNLTTGDYYFSTVSLRASSILNVDIPIGPVTINSVGQILIFEDVQTIMTPLGDGESEYLRIQSLTDIFVKDRAKVLGQLIAPNGQGNLEKDVNFRGAICAKFINITLGGAEVLDHEANGPFSNLVQEVVIDQGEWVIRPNPVRGALTIIGSIPDLNKGNQIRIVDLANRTVYSSPLSTEHVQLEIATDKWTSGFYFVILQLADEVRTFKVVKVE